MSAVKAFFSDLNNGLIAKISVSEEWQAYAISAAFVIIVIVSAYLLGSINSAIIISKTLYRDDVRKHGSGNAGTTNMLRTYGKTAAILTLLGDMLKTVVSITIAGILLGFNYSGGMSYNDGYCYIAGLFAVIGHIFPIYYGFRGGKGVLCAATMILMLTPVPFSFLLLIFIGVVASSRYVSLGSVCCAIIYPVILHGYLEIFGAKLPAIISLCSILLAILVVYCHRENLKRISNRTESKISFKKKKKESDVDGDEQK